MSGELQKQQAVEPEIIDENGRRICGGAGVGGAPRGGLCGLIAGALGALIAFLCGLAMFAVFIIFAVFAALPLLIMILVGKKPDTKIFRYKL